MKLKVLSASIVIILSILLAWCQKSKEVEYNNTKKTELTGYSSNLTYDSPFISQDILDNSLQSDDIPQCNEKNNFNNENILNIDDVVKNCSYKENYIYYYGIWWGWWLLPQIYIMEDDYVMPSIFLEDKSENICKIGDKIMINVWERYASFIEFLDKHDIKWKNLISVALPRLESIQGSSFYFSGRESFITWNEYWEKWDNYYLYGSFYPITDSNIYLVFNDKVFYAWKINTLSVGDFEIISDWRRNVVSFVENSLRVTKMDSIQLNFDVNNLDVTKFEPNSIIWTYTVKTCTLSI